jgi:hypothetical protein
MMAKDETQGKWKWTVYTVWGRRHGSSIWERELLSVHTTYEEAVEWAEQHQKFLSGRKPAVRCEVEKTSVSPC